MRRLIAALALAATPLAAAETEVDVELVLAVDISRSMDFEELKLQRDGYVQAFRDPALMRAVEGGLLGRIAVLYVEWAGPGIANVIGPWRLIETEADAAAFADDLAAGSITAAIGTSISGALAYAMESLEANAFHGLRRVVDVSGDGPNNAGPPVTEARDAAVAAGVTVNGLPLMLKAYDGPFSLRQLDVYYEDCVIGGPLSFVLPLLEAEKFAETIRRKLILEISGTTPPPDTARVVPTSGARDGISPTGGARDGIVPIQLGLGPRRTEPRIDCLIGEKRRARWMRERGWEW
jgi:hypothetical protein